MTQEFTFTSILCNTLDPGYMLTQATDDLCKLMNGATLMEIKGKTDSPRYAELLRIIPVQKRLAKAKLDNDSVFYRLGTLSARIYKHH